VIQWVRRSHGKSSRKKRQHGSQHGEARQRGDNTDKTKGEVLTYCQSIHDPERLGFAGWLTEPKRTRRGILIFRKVEDAKLKALIDDLPAVKSMKWTAKTFPLDMTDGIVK
jgi:hypothetical protein